MRPKTFRLRRTTTAVTTLVLAATLGGPTLAASADKSTTTTSKPSLECSVSQLSFAGPTPIAPQAGGQAFMVTLTNVSSHLCQVHGYPSVRFYTSGGRLLTFTYKHTSPYFAHPKARLLNLEPHAHAYFELAKGRCATIGNRFLSNFFYVLPPYTAGSPWVGHVGTSGVTQFDYCKGSAHGPGQSVGISALVASPTQLG